MVRREGLPEWGELVLVTVERITTYAAWCKLEEYPGIEGMIHVSEVSGKWVRDIRDFVKLGKQYVAKVVRIDYQKNFVNLSLKRVSPDEEKEKMNVFRKEQRAEKMLEQAAKKLGKSIEDAYKEVGFLLQKKFGQLSTAFSEIKKEPQSLIKAGIPEKWVNALVEVAEKSIQEKEVKIKAELNLKFFSEDGIEKIRQTLNKLEKNGIVVKYISAPKYMAEIKTKNPKNDERKFKEKLEEVIREVNSLGGEGSYKLIK